MERKRERAAEEELANKVEENLEKIKKRRMEQEEAYAELYPGGKSYKNDGKSINSKTNI